MTTAVGGEGERETYIDVSDLNVFQRLNIAYKVIADYKFVKDKYVETRRPNSSKKDDKGDGYWYVSIGQILEAVRNAHAQAGLVVIFGVPEYDTEKGEKRYTYIKKEQKWNPNYQRYDYTGKETTWYAANGHVDVSIFGRDEDDCIRTMVAFEVQDNSDKLTNKILTNAQRSLYRTLYAIDGDDAQDPEAINNGGDEPVDEPPKEDRFFGSNGGSANEVPSEFKTADQLEPMTSGRIIPPEKELDNILNVKGATPQHKELVKNFKLSNGAKSVYDLSFDQKVELYNIILDQEGEQ